MEDILKNKLSQHIMNGLFECEDTVCSLDAIRAAVRNVTKVIAALPVDEVKAMALFVGELPFSLYSVPGGHGREYRVLAREGKSINCRLLPDDEVIRECWYIASDKPPCRHAQAVELYLEMERGPS